jgi:acetyl esterase/lipase
VSSAGAWVLAALAVALAVPVVAMAWFMLVPVGWDRGGRVGVLGLAFPLHLLVVTLGSGLLAALTWWASATVAAVVFLATAVLSGAVAAWPAAALWRRARGAGERLSLATYVREARRPNWGGPPPTETVAFGPDLHLDVWRPAAAVAAGGQPAVVRVHGGGWVAGGRGEMPAWTAWLNERGYVVFDIDYRLAPPPRWQEAAADVEAAVRWVVEHHQSYGVDRGRITLMGHSAGGHVALLAAYGGAARVRAVVNVYGPGDLDALYRHTDSPAYIGRCLDAFVGGGPDDLANRYRGASPRARVTDTSPPTITVLGRRDRIVPADQAHALGAALSAAGVSHESVLLPATDHGFDLNWGGFGTQLARARIGRFLAEHG